MKKVIDGTNYQTKTQKLKKTYVDKIVSFLSKKYAGFFKDKNYTLEHLTKDVGKNLPDKDVKTFNMTTSLPKFEKMILEKISKMESKKNVTLKMGNINKLLSHNDNDIKNNSSSSRKVKSTSHPKSIIKQSHTLHEEQQQQQKEHPQADLINNIPENINQIQNINQTPAVSNTENINKQQNIVQEMPPYLTEKMEKLKLKQNDKWAKITNDDYAKYVEEQERKRLLIEKQKQEQKLFLEQQIKEKELQKQKYKQEEADFYNKNKNANPFIQNNSKSNMANNQLPDNNNQVNQQPIQYKQQQMNIEKQQYNQQIQNEINAFNQEEERKRLEKREMYLKLQKENEEIAKMKLQNKKQNLNNNAVHQNEQVEEYFPFGKNDINYNRRRRVDVNNTNDLSHPFNQQEQVRKAYEAQKLQREMEEKLKREEENEEFKREQKRKMINEFKSGLDQQISEKNNLKTKAINDGKLNDFNEIQRLNKEVMEEQLNNERIKLDKQNQYKQILNEQVRQNKKQFQYEYE